MNSIDRLLNETARAARVSIFDEPWWFEAACPGAWDVCEIRRDNQMLASLAFHTFNKFGMRYIQMPKLTRTLQPVLHPPGKKAVSRLQQQVSLLTELRKKLPRHDRMELCLPPESDLPFAFVECGFRATQTFTFRSDPYAAGDPWLEMEQKTRNVVQSAQKRFSIEEHADIERFIRLSRKERASGQGEDRCDYPATARLFEAAHARHQAVILSAMNDRSEEAAAAILVWDEHVVYYWLSVRDAQLSRGANSLLLWSAYRLAQKSRKIFDLDGFITPQNGMFLARFGFQPVARTFVTYSTPVWQALFSIRSAFPAERAELRYR